MEIWVVLASRFHPSVHGSFEDVIEAGTSARKRFADPLRVFDQNLLNGAGPRDVVTSRKRALTACPGCRETEIPSSRALCEIPPGGA
jgi:hypothetical protein